MNKISKAAARELTKVVEELCWEYKAELGVYSGFVHRVKMMIAGPDGGEYVRLDDVKENLSQWHSKVFNNLNISPEVWVENMLRGIPRHSIPKSDGWISVEDRLPESEVIAINNKKRTYGYGERLLGYISPSEDYGYICENDYEVLQNVTHWQPLPKALEEK